MSDIKHRKLQNKIIKNFNKRSKSIQYKFKMEAEAQIGEYKKYYVDILETNETLNRPIRIHEVKTKLSDVGSTLRQIQNYVNITNPSSHWSASLHIYHTKENLDVISDCYEMFESKKYLLIKTYDPESLELKYTFYMSKHSKKDYLWEIGRLNDYTGNIFICELCGKKERFPSRSKIIHCMDCYENSNIKKLKRMKKYEV